jgi:hypothetical protein
VRGERALLAEALPVADLDRRDEPRTLDACFDRALGVRRRDGDEREAGGDDEGKSLHVGSTPRSRAGFRAPSLESAP